MKVQGCMCVLLTGGLLVHNVQGGQNLKGVCCHLTFTLQLHNYIDVSSRIIGFAVNPIRSTLEALADPFLCFCDTKAAGSRAAVGCSCNVQSNHS